MRHEDLLTGMDRQTRAKALRDWRFAASKRVAGDAPSLAGWYVISVLGGMECEIDKEMQQAGLHSWLPMRTERRKVKNRRGGRRKAKREIQVPAFPGYLFCRCVPSTKAFHGVRSFEGVLQILGDADGPRVLADKEVERLVKIIEKKAFDFSTGRNAFASGQNVTFSSGPFEYYQGVVADGYNGGMSVPVLVEMLGRKSLLFADVDCLAAVA